MNNDDTFDAISFDELKKVISTSSAIPTQVMLDTTQDMSPNPFQELDNKLNSQRGEPGNTTLRNIRFNQLEISENE